MFAFGCYVGVFVVCDVFFNCFMVSRAFASWTYLANISSSLSVVSSSYGSTIIVTVFAIVVFLADGTVAC